MNNQKEFNEANEKDLEQVAGGSNGDLEGKKYLYRCPVCGYEAWVASGLSPVYFDTYCSACRKNGQEVKMKQVR